MKIRIEGEMPIPALIKALYQEFRLLEDTYNVKFVRGAALYLTPTDGLGDEVECRDTLGNVVQELRSKGAYKSIAQDYQL